MANRYWVLGNGTWSLTATTNWSASSGGAGGATAPTPSDDVYFDVNSNVGTGNWTVTLGSAATCASFNVIGLDGQVTFNLGTLYTNTLTVYGGINVSTTVTNLYYSSTSPNWASTFSNVFTTTNFIKIGLTATSMAIIPIATSVTKISGSANIAEPPVFLGVLSSRLPLNSTNISEVPVFPQSLSTSLAFTTNFPLSLPAIPIRINEKFGESSSNTITPLPYQFWG